VWNDAAIPHEAHDTLWSAFDGGGLFVDAGEASSAWWDEWGWREARAYHEATRDYPFLQMTTPDAFAADTERMRRYRVQAPPPPVYQRLGAGSQLPLPPLPEDQAPDDWLRRAVLNESSGRTRVGALLDACFGERGRIATAEGSPCLLKSIPSGGARHPTELFLAAFELSEVPPGVYHYDVEHHRLDEVRGGQHRAAFAAATLDLFDKLDAPPCAAVVFTSLVERAMWRYRDPRSFRAILVDVGHAVSAYRRVARLLGYRTYAYQKMDDAAIADLLGIDRFRQPPLYVGTLVG
jgi:SagB-type dehydrogenase family enzyme